MNDDEFQSKVEPIHESDHSLPSRSVSNQIKIDKNQLLLMYLNLPFIYVSSGFGKPRNMPDLDLPDVSNPEMFSLQQLLSLRTELIHLKAFIDKQSMAQINLYQDVSQMVRNFQSGNSVEREVKRIRFPKTEAKPEVVQEVKPPDPVEPPEKEKTKKLKNKHHSHHKEKNDPDKPKPLTSETIWDTTDRFFKPIKTPNYFDRYLQLSRPTYDINKLQEPLGTHYSITYSKMASIQNDPLKSQIKMPSPPFADPNNSGSTHLHKRLISAILDLNDTTPDTNSCTSDTEFLEEGEKIEQNDVSKDKKLQNDFTNLGNAGMNALPVACRAGNSAYGQLDFEKRLKLELDSLGIVSSGQTFVDMNYPVMRYLNDKVVQQRTACDEANRCRRFVEQYVALGQRKFQEVVKRNRDWNSALALYLELEAKDKSNSKKKTKSQSTKAIKEEYSSKNNSSVTSDNED